MMDTAVEVLTKLLKQNNAQMQRVIESLADCGRGDIKKSKVAFFAGQHAALKQVIGNLEALLKIAIEKAQREPATQLAEPVEVSQLSSYTATVVHPRNNVEADFFERFGRLIDTGGPHICSGGAIRCQDCRCGLDKDWRKQP